MENENNKGNANTNLNAKASRIEAKNARIAEKSKRISNKGRSIAERNKYIFSAPETESDTKSELATEDFKDDTIVIEDFVPFKKENFLKPRNHTATVATILSAVSILLLISLFFCFAFGVLKIDGANTIVVNTSNKTPATDSADDSTPQMLEKFKSSVVVVTVERLTGTGTGTGIVLMSNGYIVTNYHVVSDAVSVYVKLYGAEGYTKAEVVGFSKNDDVAVLKINKTDLSPATFAADCSEYLAGERVFAVGTPVSTEYSWTVTQGILSCVNRNIKFYGADGIMTKKWRVMQTDTPVNPGNSGGPLIDSNGVVVGMITSKLEESEGMGFALPADGVMEIALAIIDKGSADHIKSPISSGRPLVGVTCVSVEANSWYRSTDSGIEAVTADYASANPDSTFYAEESGVYVKYVEPSRDAYGKIKEGDIITHLNNIRVYTQLQLINELYQFREGDVVKLKFYRNGEQLEAGITLKEAPIP